MSCEALCVGMSVVDILATGVTELPEPGTTSMIRGVSLSIGGDALNEAAIIRRLGHSVGLITAVGDDACGAYIRHECEANGIDVSGIHVNSRYVTSASIVLIQEDGERSFLSRPDGSADHFGMEDVNFSILKPGLKVLSIGSLFTSRNFDLECAVPLLRRAKEIGAVTVADFVLNRKDGTLRELAEALRFLDYAIPSSSEALYYTGTATADDAARALLNYGVKNVVIKMGTDGALARNAERSWIVPAIPARTMDTTGAGDNFVGGFIAGLLEDRPLEECIEFAAATASISVESVGATSGVRSREQVLERWKHMERKDSK